MAASIPLNSGSQTTTTSPSLSQSPFSRRTSGQTMNTIPSPAQTPSQPAQTNDTTSVTAQEPANPPNSGLQTAQTTSHPAATLPTNTARTPLTKEQKLDRHKRAEAGRRNRIARNLNYLCDEWNAPEFRLPVNKWNKKKESLIAAGNWLEQLQSGNDELENIYNAMLETQRLLTESHPTSQAQTQEQLGLLRYTPPLSQSPPDEQPGAWFPPVFPDLNQLPPQLPNALPPPPPPQPNPYQHYPPSPRDDPMLVDEDFSAYPADTQDPRTGYEDFMMT